FRKAYGALKDSTRVGLAKVNSSFKELDVAIVKATNHVERPPKERHIRKIFAATSISCPRADVGYCIHALLKRLSKTSSWIVAVKAMIVFHRILREGDLAFKEDLLRISGRRQLFKVSNFKDNSCPLAWDCSAWVRSYAMFLEERVECLRTLKSYDTESDRGSKSAIGDFKDHDHSATSKMNSKELLEQLPTYQQLLFRLICCQPEGAARRNFLVQYAFALVVKESFKIYSAINDGIINLVDMFFEMPKDEAIKALNIYKKAARQADHLAEFYRFCKTLELSRTFQFPTLRQPPPSFLMTMEQYIKEAPQRDSGGSQIIKQIDSKLEDPSGPDNGVTDTEIDDKKMVHEENTIISKAPPLIQPFDLLSSDETTMAPQETQPEERNDSSALAPVESGGGGITVDPASRKFSEPLLIGENGTMTAGWELALVTTPSSSSSSSKPEVDKTKTGGGFDKSFLDSLYEDDASRRRLQLHRAGYTTGFAYEMNPQHVPFAMVNSMTMQQQNSMMMMMMPSSDPSQQHRRH
ncbi:hypothetical protein M569_02679, partial [Genlisea aurea]